jgi:Trehalase-like, N-terminal
MTLRIGDYALLSDCNTGALVGRDGSVDWLCLPRYDSPAVFARILDPDAGHWSIRPRAGYETRRRYLEGSLVLETTLETANGTAALIDALAFERGQRSHALGLDAPHELLRLVKGLSGRVELELELAWRPEYGLASFRGRAGRARARRPRGTQRWGSCKGAWDQPGRGAGATAPGAPTPPEPAARLGSRTHRTNLGGIRMNTKQRELHGFEQRLLDELRRMIVLERPGLASPPTTRARILRAGFGRRRRLTLAGGIAIVAALALMAGLPFVDGGSGTPGGGPRAAYAVTSNDNGTVTVEINALRDAKGLEHKLRLAGIPAVVQYLPAGTSCSEEAFTLVSPARPGAGAIETSGDGSLRFEIDTNSLQPGQKLFIYTQDLEPNQQGEHPTEPASAIGVSVVDGKVFAGC